MPGTVAEDLRSGMPVTPIVRFDGVWCDSREAGFVLHATDLLVFPEEQEFYNESGGSEEASSVDGTVASVFAPAPPIEFRRTAAEADDPLDVGSDGCDDWQTSVCHSRFPQAHKDS